MQCDTSAIKGLSERSYNLNKQSYYSIAKKANFKSKHNVVNTTVVYEGQECKTQIRIVRE